MDICFDYSSDPMYLKYEVIDKLGLTFFNGYWWRDGKKCVPREFQEQMLLFDGVEEFYWWPRIKRTLIKSGTIKTKNVNKRPKTKAKQSLSAILSKTVKYANKLDKISTENRERIEKMSLKSREHDLVKELVTKEIPDLYILAFEYNIDDGCHFRQQHGDVLLYNAEKAIIYVIECKCINNSEKRRINVREQALRCANRIQSWLFHLSNVDPNYEILAKCKIIPATYTNETKKLVMLF